MNNPYSSLSEKELLNQLKEPNQLAFSALYDRYAPSLLGVITHIVHHNGLDATLLLEKTFINVRSQITQFNPEQHSLFVWLLNISRQTAVDALLARKNQRPSAIQLTVTDKVMVSRSQNTTPVPAQPATVPVDPRLKKLVDSILFDNCTPEEAAASLGLPAESARQQLRLAMQQLRVVR
jgi:RNA polymerase sigma factor (sigma-70 family)